MQTPRWPRSLLSRAHGARLVLVPRILPTLSVDLLVDTSSIVMSFGGHASRYLIYYSVFEQCIFLASTMHGGAHLLLYHCWLSQAFVNS